jgi:hypothetical protein
MTGKKASERVAKDVGVVAKGVPTSSNNRRGGATRAGVPTEIITAMLSPSQLRRQREAAKAAAAAAAVVVRETSPAQEEEDEEEDEGMVTPAPTRRTQTVGRSGGGASGGAAVVSQAKELEEGRLRALKSDALHLKRYQEAFALKSEGWCSNVSKQAGVRCFSYQQFLYGVDSEKYGSKWQKMVCIMTNVPEKNWEAWWNGIAAGGGGGMVVARNTLNRRRMNVTNAIKVKFLGKREEDMGG